MAKGWPSIPYLSTLTGLPEKTLHGYADREELVTITVPFGEKTKRLVNPFELRTFLLECVKIPSEAVENVMRSL